jgi:hypothetical protein
MEQDVNSRQGVHFFWHKHPVPVNIREEEGETTPPRPQSFQFTFQCVRSKSKMNDAVANNENWASDNTTVTFDPENNESTVYLHGHKIAEVGDDFLRVF